MKLIDRKAVLVAFLALMLSCSGLVFEGLLKTSQSPGGQPITTLDPLLKSGMGGFLQLIQEFGSLRNQVEKQEEMNRLLEQKVTRLEKLLEQVNKTAVEENNYLSQGVKVQEEISTLFRTTAMMASEMTNVVTTATMLEVEMMKVQRSLDDVTDCHATFTTRLDNMTSSLDTASLDTGELLLETGMLNQTTEELHKDLTELHGKSDDLTVTTNRIDSMACDSGRLYFRGDNRFIYSSYNHNQWPETQTVRFSRRFSRSPSISYGVVAMEADKDYDIKFNLTISDVTSSGFKLQNQANGKNELKMLDVQWMACLV